MTWQAAGLTQVKLPARSCVYSMSVAFWTKSNSWRADSSEIVGRLGCEGPAAGLPPDGVAAGLCGPWSRGGVGLGGLPMRNWLLLLPAGGFWEGLQLFRIRQPPPNGIRGDTSKLDREQVEQ